MAVARKINRLSAECAAYLAGLIDGEGTVTLTRAHRRENRRLVVSISNNDLLLLSFVNTAIGAGKVTTKKTYSKRHARSFTYQISSRQALDLLEQVTPHLRTYKAIRARLALANYLRLTPRNGRYTPATSGQRLEFENQFLAITG
jgi:hypothetical protein